MPTPAPFTSFKLVLAIVFVAALSRLLPHPYNFTPIAAMALFGGAYIQHRSSALIITLGSMFLSDILLHGGYLIGWRAYPGFHALMPLVYLSLVAITTIGGSLSGRVKAWNIPLASITGSVLFFILTNFGVFLFETTHTWLDFVRTYTQAIPFFGNTLAGDLLYSGLLFGGYEWAKRSQLKWA